MAIPFQYLSTHGKWHTPQDLKAVRNDLAFFRKERKRRPDDQLAYEIYNNLSLLRSFYKGDYRSLDEQSVGMLIDGINTMYRSWSGQGAAHQMSMPDFGDYQVYFDATPLYRDMAKSIARAKDRVCLMSYILTPDAAGILIADALSAKAREFKGKAGKEVIAVIDAIGMRYGDFTDSQRQMLLTSMREAGVRVHVFNSITSSVFTDNVRELFRDPRMAFLGRNHCKLLVVDADTAYLGGMNISNDYDRIRDTHMRIRGEIVEALVKRFYEMLVITERLERAALPYHDRKLQQGEYDLLRVKEATMRMPRLERTTVTMNRPDVRRNEIFKEYLHRIDAAQSSIWITNAYFVPGWRIARALGAAARRGVDVQVITSAKSDHPTVAYAATPFVEYMLRQGVKVMLLDDPRYGFVHAKTMVVDGMYSVIGSSNLDYVSFLNNYELNICVAHKALALELNERFRSDLRSCIPYASPVKGIIGKVQAAVSHTLLYRLMLPDPELA